VFYAVWIFLALAAAAFLWTKCHLDTHNKQWQVVVQCAGMSVFEQMASHLALGGLMFTGVLMTC
jgi:hypothetical protein